jgi:hypothetical protein
MLDIVAFTVVLTFKEISFLGVWVWLLGASNDPDHTNAIQKFPPSMVAVFLHWIPSVGRVIWGETQEVESNKLRQWLCMANFPRPFTLKLITPLCNYIKCWSSLPTFSLSKQYFSIMLWIWLARCEYSKNRTPDVSTSCTALPFGTQVSAISSKLKQ